MSQPPTNPRQDDERREDRAARDEHEGREPQGNVDEHRLRTDPADRDDHAGSDDAAQPAPDAGSSDDPRLTALALGELGGQDATELQALLASDDELRAKFDALRDTAERVGESLRAQAEAHELALDDERRDTIRAAAAGSEALADADAERGRTDGRSEERATHRAGSSGAEPAKRTPVHRPLALAASIALAVGLVTSLVFGVDAARSRWIPTVELWLSRVATGSSLDDLGDRPGGWPAAVAESGPPSSDSAPAGAGPADQGIQAPPVGQVAAAPQGAESGNASTRALAEAVDELAEAEADFAESEDEDEDEEPHFEEGAPDRSAVVESDWYEIPQLPSHVHLPELSMGDSAGDAAPGYGYPPDVARAPDSPAAGAPGVAPSRSARPSPRAPGILPDDGLHDDARVAPPRPPAYENPFVPVAHQPLSTFGVDVDTASYALVRRALRDGHWPSPEHVRIEELLNYFDYDDAGPGVFSREPFAVHVEIAEAPWRPEHRLARIGIQGRELDGRERPPANLVFLVDVSGSMDAPDKLPLVRDGLRMLTEQLDARDRVAVVTYAGHAGVALPPTAGDAKATIRDMIGRLTPGGSTNGAGGIQMAYDLAARHLDPEGVNRVILATDGDFNVGISDQDQLRRLIEDQAQRGVFLTVLGFGTGNLRDGKLETLADHGNGHYAYIDGPSEARKVLVEELSATLVPIAKDVKVQVEFNPAQVGAYRLIGYENRVLANRDFRDDRVDAGDIGAGHHVTALYELAPPDGTTSDGEPLRYQDAAEAPSPAWGTADETMLVKLRWKAPDGDRSELLELPVRDRGATMAESSEDLRFASAVAAFGMHVRGSRYVGRFGPDRIRDLAEDAIGEDARGLRREFVELLWELP